jgi:DNA-binding transcriptional MerR regulator/effector-binding domain-containing protein
MPPAQPPLLRIGPFSRLARVTIKTLRFYASAGLFRPAWIDPRSGYRFYSPTQLPLLRRIRALRELGCSVSEIQRLTAAYPDGCVSHTETAVLRRRLMVAVALAEQRLRQLDAMSAAYVGAVHEAAGHEAAAHESGDHGQLPNRLLIEERQVTAIPALTLRDSVRAGGNDIQRMFESAERQVARLGMRAPQSPFVLLHDMDYQRPQSDVEVCVPTRAEALGHPAVRLIEPVARAACVGFSGDYGQARVLFDATLDSVHAKGARIAGPIREVYLRFGADQRGYTLDPQFLTDDPRQYRTELLIPLSGAG